MLFRSFEKFKVYHLGLCLSLVSVISLKAVEVALPDPSARLSTREVQELFVSLSDDIRDEFNQETASCSPALAADFFDGFVKEKLENLESRFSCFQEKLSGFTRALYMMLANKVKPFTLKACFPFSSASVIYLVSSLFREIFRFNLSLFLFGIFLLTFHGSRLTFHAELHSITHLFSVRRE